MPRERTYTDTGYIETQWSRSGELVCVEAADITSDGRLTDVTFHQFTHPDELSAIIRALKRARRQAFDTFSPRGVFDGGGMLTDEMAANIRRHKTGG